MVLPKEANVVYIGRKPLMNYVLAVVTCFASNANNVVLKARGRAISVAVDVAEISRRSFLENVRVDKIEIGSEHITIREEKRTKAVSTIEITLAHIFPMKKEMGDEGEEKPANKKHIAKLTDIKGIGVKNAEKLKSSGISSVRDLADSDLALLSENLQISEKRLMRWVDEAKKAVKPQ